MHYREREQGITLVETMIASTIMVSLGLMVTMWLTGVSDMWWTTTSQSSVRTSVQQAVNRMTSELRDGTRTTWPVAPSLQIPAAPTNTSMTFYLPADGPDADSLIIDANGNTEWDLVNAVQYIWDAPTQQLQRVQGLETSILANGVMDARFEDASIDNTLFLNEVRVTLTLQERTPQGRTLTATSVEVVKLRN